MRTASVLEEILFNGALMFAVYRDNSVVSAFSRALIIGSITTSLQKINYCFEKKSGKSLDFYGHSKICTDPVITIMFRLYHIPAVQFPVAVATVQDLIEPIVLVLAVPSRTAK